MSKLNYWGKMKADQSVEPSVPGVEFAACTSQ